MVSVDAILSRFVGDCVRYITCVDNLVIVLILEFDIQCSLHSPSKSDGDMLASPSPMTET